ncbi:hypothetical protein THAOC_06732 [Thalassiosira oceanica]|uniref:Uncharacterized protein n=1 Tax=Thalassiosira oceanica TaxID=159749 RepID=K0T201_THAOC|nr:hypothetical protein THAOC_06732 [Thalassiosira oceanica]|eukprot:EJK71795.1 hypothetical protein THAOC_06732 [Thalassiosira oceanica]
MHVHQLRHAAGLNSISLNREQAKRPRGGDCEQLWHLYEISLGHEQSQVVRLCLIPINLARAIESVERLSERPASGVRGDDGVYPARPSALYTPTGPLGWSVASVNLKQHIDAPSVVDLSAPILPPWQRGWSEGEMPLDAARYAIMSSVESAATGFNDLDGRALPRRRVLGLVGLCWFCARALARAKPASGGGTPGS